jgi:hypothetical protein
MDLARRELRRALQEIIRIEQIAALEVPVKDEERIWAALHDTPTPPLPGVLAAWNVLHVRRNERSYGVTFAVGRSFYTTAITPFFCVLLREGRAAATFWPAGRRDLGPLVSRFAVERALGALGLRFPRDLWTPEGCEIAWDLLTCGGSFAAYPGPPALPAPVTSSAYRAQDEGEITLPPVRWGDEGALATFKLAWRPRRLELVTPS